MEDIERCAEARPGGADAGPALRAGYGRAVLGAALAYVRRQKAGLLREVAEAAERPAAALARAE